MHRRRTKEGPGPVISTSANYRVCIRECVLHQRQPCVWCEGAESVHAVIWCVWYYVRCIMNSEYMVLCPLGEWYLSDAPEDQTLSAAHDGRPAYLHICNTSVCVRCVLCSHHYLINKLCATDFWNARITLSHSPMCHHTRTAHDVRFGSAFVLWANGLAQRVNCWKMLEICSSNLQGRRSLYYI